MVISKVFLITAILHCFANKEPASAANNKGALSVLIDV
jgi:hypothetical protein